MLLNIKTRIKTSLNIEVSGRFTNVRKDDIFLVSYPKSGNTWMRFLIGNLVSQEKVDFNNVNNIIPDMYQTSKQELDRLQNPRIIKSHEKYTASYPKAIFIYRDPRDVAISYFFWKKKYKKDFKDEINEYLKAFIDGKGSAYGAWEDHYSSWVNSATNAEGRLLLLKYEDIKSNELKELRKICAFLNINVGDKDIINAIENSNFKKMQKLEEQQSDTSTYLKNSDKKIKFVRSGKSEWNKYLKGKLKDAFKAKYGELLIDLGYEKDMSW